MQPLDQPDLSKLSGLPDPPGVPSKQYYTISEVSNMCGVKPHVLRYWENEFPSLRPRKGRAGSRRYRQRDIEEVLAIKSLLHDQGYRIAGARKYLRQQQRPSAGSPVDLGGPHAADQFLIPFGQLEHKKQLEYVRRELTDVLALLRNLVSEQHQSHMDE